jgi:hypothetical protein
LLASKTGAEKERKRAKKKRMIRADADFKRRGKRAMTEKRCFAEDLVN